VEGQQRPMKHATEKGSTSFGKKDQWQRKKRIVTVSLYSEDYSELLTLYSENSEFL
jgi:hypothetical protein